MSDNKLIIPLASELSKRTKKPTELEYILKEMEKAAADGNNSIEYVLSTRTKPDFLNDFEEAGYTVKLLEHIIHGSKGLVATIQFVFKLKIKWPKI